MIVLCCRQAGQGTTDEVRSRDLRRELEDKERDARAKRSRDKPRSFTGEEEMVELENTDARVWSNLSLGRRSYAHTRRSYAHTRVQCVYTMTEEVCWRCFWDNSLTTDHMQVTDWVEV